MKDFIDIFIGDAIQISITSSLGINYIGILNREHLREDIRTLIFKYGAKPQGEWTMLAQISRIPEPKDLFKQIDSFADLLADFDISKVRTISDFFNILMRL